jgi:hypothetical protein
MRNGSVAARPAPTNEVAAFLVEVRVDFPSRGRLIFGLDARSPSAANDRKRNSGSRIFQKGVLLQLFGKRWEPELRLPKCHAW